LDLHHLKMLRVALLVVCAGIIHCIDSNSIENAIKQDMNESKRGAEIAQLTESQGKLEAALSKLVKDIESKSDAAPAAPAAPVAPADVPEMIQPADPVDNKDSKREAQIAKLKESQDRLEVALGKLVQDMESKSDEKSAEKSDGSMAAETEVEIDAKTTYHDGLKLFEGDIVDTEELQKHLNDLPVSENVKRDASYTGKWPDAVIIYDDSQVAGHAATMAVLNAAIADYHRLTCIRFRKRTTETNYVNVIKGGGCYSYIGRIGGQQPLSLGNGCESKGIAIHEFMHALGFYHEQSRLDRDNFITIDFTNIQETYWNNFQKYAAGRATTHDEPYDKQSVMHYDNYAFAIDGSKRVITSKSNPTETLGQRVGLSDIDIRQLNKHYGCADTTVTTTVTPATTKAPVITQNITTAPPVTQAPITLAPPTGKDKYPFCKCMKDYCTNEFVATNCAGTCNPECKDTYRNPAYCTAWAGSSYNFCKSIRYGRFMQKYCRQSCGFC